MSDNHNLPQIPRKNLTESTLERFKMIADVAQGVPIPGNVIPSIVIGRILDSFREKRVEKGFEDIIKYIEMISEKILRLEEFKDAAILVVTNYEEAPSAEVRELVSILNKSLFEKLSNSEDDPKPVFDNFILFSKLLRQLSFPALYCLKNFRNEFPKLKATRFEIVNYLQERFPLAGKHAFMELVNNSLIEEEGAKEQPPSFEYLKKRQREEKTLGQRYYELQPLGTIFSEWIEAKGKVPQGE